MRMIVWSIKKFLKLVRHSIVLSILFYFSICVSVLTYLIFYNWYLPKANFQRNVELEIQNTHYIINNKDYWSKELVGFAYLFDGSSEALQSGQEYAVSLAMNVPESDANFDIGMFGITVDVVDIDGRVSFSFKTTGTLNYKPVLLRYLTTLIYFPYYILGRYEQNQVLNIVLKENFVDNPYMPANKFIIKIHEKVQFYSVTLNVQAKFKGLKYLLSTWFYTTSIGLCLLITLIVFLMFITSVYGGGNSSKLSENKLVSKQSKLFENDENVLNEDYYDYKEKYIKKFGIEH